MMALSPEQIRQRAERERLAACGKEEKKVPRDLTWFWLVAGIGVGFLIGLPVYAKLLTPQVTPAQCSDSLNVNSDNSLRCARRGLIDSAHYYVGKMDAYYEMEITTLKW